MEVKLAYLGRSTLTGDDSQRSLSFAPNLTRDPVAFNAAIKASRRERAAVAVAGATPVARTDPSRAALSDSRSARAARPRAKSSGSAAISDVVMRRSAAGSA